MKDQPGDNSTGESLSGKSSVWKYQTGQTGNEHRESITSRSTVKASMHKPKSNRNIDRETSMPTKEISKDKSLKELWGWTEFLPDEERAEVDSSLTSSDADIDEPDNDDVNYHIVPESSMDEHSNMPVKSFKEEEERIQFKPGRPSLNLMGVGLGSDGDVTHDEPVSEDPHMKGSESQQLKEIWSWTEDKGDESSIISPELEREETEPAIEEDYIDDDEKPEREPGEIDKVSHDFSEFIEDEDYPDITESQDYAGSEEDDEAGSNGSFEDNYEQVSGRRLQGVPGAIDELNGDSEDESTIELENPADPDDELEAEPSPTGLDDKTTDLNDMLESRGPVAAGQSGVIEEEDDSETKEKPDEPIDPDVLPGPVKIDPAAKSEAKTDESEATTADNLQRNQSWGYGFVLFTLFTMFGSITIATYLVFLRSNMSIPNIIVYVSVVALLVFLGMLIARYVVLIFLSFLHHNRNKAQDRIVVSDLKATILVPAYNEEKVIERSILSLLELNYPEYEIIVINDGSTDKTLKVARSLEGMHGNVKVKVLTQKNLGKAQALNHGALEASGDVLICMDGDSRLSIDCLLMGMRHFVDPEIGSIAGNVKVLNRVNLWTRLQALEYIEGLNLVRRAQAFLRVVNIVPGPIGFFRRSAILDVGGWDNDTFAEDCDLTLKLLTKGYKIDYEPESISYTEAPERLIQLLKQRYRWTRGILQSMRKHSSFLINPRPGWRVLVIMWQMVFEAIIWPLMNVLANVLFLIVALLFGMSPLIVLWWVQLTILDVIAAIHTVAIERENLLLVPLAVVYRLFFIQLVDVAKLIAIIEELLNIKMGWGKIERIGRL